MVKEQRYSDDISSYNGAILLMAGLLIISVLLLFIMTGFRTQLLLVVLVMLAMFSYYRVSMHKAVQNLDRYDIKGKAIEETFDKESVTQKLSYLNAALDLKMTRIRSVTLFYVFNFPFFLLSVKELLHGPSSTLSLIHI